MSFVGGLSRKVIGWGKRYFREIFWSSRSQDLEDGLAEASIFLAWLEIMLSPSWSLVIMPKRENMRR